MYDCMLCSGIKPDNLAYSIILDVHIKSKNAKKLMMLYQNMVSDGFIPDLALYEALLRVLGAESNNKCIRQVVKDLENLIMSCNDNERFAEASQVFSDMKFYCIEPSGDIYHRMSLVYCKMDLPEMAHHLFEQAEMKGLPLHRTSICTGLVDAYGKLKKLEKTESVVGRLRRTSQLLDRKVWKSLIQAYAASGCYEKARVAFNTMMRDGPSPTDRLKYLLPFRRERTLDPVNWGDQDDHMCFHRPCIRQTPAKSNLKFNGFGFERMGVS